MKLITFSLFGDNPLYCVGAVENARLAKEIYPDWTARFYVAQDVPSMYLDAIEEYDTMDDISDFSDGDAMYGMTGAASDQDVDRVGD